MREALRRKGLGEQVGVHDADINLQLKSFPGEEG